MSPESGVLVTGPDSTSPSSADTVGIGSATPSALLSDSGTDAATGISSGGCSTAADASTSNNGALTAAATIQTLHTVSKVSNAAVS